MNVICEYSRETATMDTTLARLYRKGDRIMLLVVWALFVLSIVLAPLHGTWALALTIGMALAPSAIAVGAGAGR